MFGTRATQAALRSLRVQILDENYNELSEITPSLLEAGRTAKDLLEAPYDLESKYPERRRMMRVLQTILLNIIKSLHGAMAPSEIDGLIVWAFIFRDEQGCAAAALSKCELSEVFDTGTTTRKCYCILGVAGLQVGNMEAKKARASPQEFALQLRKNLKIYKSIKLDMDAYGVGCPPLLNIHAAEFRIFVQRSAYTLFRLLNEYDNYARQVIVAKEAHDYEQKAKAQEQYVALDPLLVSETLEWNKVVLHTSSKAPPTKAQRAALLRRSQEEIQEQDDETENDWSHSSSLRAQRRTLRPSDVPGDDELES
ncbi:hypothetical protein BGZ98_004158 [Dissophora globulifera]|nr:hypothetical protein BGZ98_004158 [Dissophora globulifera]